MAFYHNYSKYIEADATGRAQQPPQVALSRIKRIFDLVFAVAALVFIFPCMLIIGIAVAADMRGKVIFSQSRRGIGGNTFRILKFRTMKVAEDGAVVTQATAADPRVTPLGAFLRRSSLDELPQLLNVVRGEMSLVGPRPHALAHDDEFASAYPPYALRMGAKPGITGLAQVSGCRGEICQPDDLHRRVGLDLKYIESWSIGLDVMIVAKTCVRVFQDDKAY
jgi:lipopolysaccharide/colanic/teichoic acid biosynthesis glycosyltransferase